MKPTFIDTYFPVVKDAAGRESVVLRVLHGIYFVLLTVLIGSQVVSKFMMSGMQILLAVNWFIEGVYILATRGLTPDPSTEGEGRAERGELTAGEDACVPGRRAESGEGRAESGELTAGEDACVPGRRGKRGDERNVKRKTSNVNNWLLYGFLVLMGVHVVWLIGTSNREYGLDDLFRKLPLLAIPLVILTSKSLNRKQLHWLLFVFVSTVFVATIIGLVRLLTIPDLPYRDTVPFISHIRFSLNICVAIVLLIWMLFRCRSLKEAMPKGTWADRRERRNVRGRGHLRTKAGSGERCFHFSLFTFHFSLLLLLLLFWFVAFLFILRSYTALFVLFVTSWVMLIFYWRKMGNVRRWVMTAMVTMTIAVAAVVMIHVSGYYDCCGSESADLPQLTANGNPYFHAQDGMVENGNQVNNYICKEELCREWPKRSTMSIYDTTPNGYTVYPTLVRYLNSKGLTKDSVGVAALDAHDVELIEKGVANHVYDDGTAMKKMCYVLLFEYENYRTSGSVRNSSMLERIALWRGAWRVFCDNPLFGVGTGDGVDELHARLNADGSQIADTEKHAHNQYLSFLVSFGLVGFLLIALAFVNAFRRIGLRRMPALLAIIVILLISFISEDTMETLAGCVLCTVIPCLLAKAESGKRRAESGERRAESGDQ